MVQTQACLEVWLARDLATMVHDYIRPDGDARDYDIAMIGHGELCLTISYLNGGLRGACQGGHLELAQLMIRRGADAWDYGLWDACEGGHPELVQLMIDKGATRWDWALNGACTGDHPTLMQLAIGNGARSCNSCGKSADGHRIRAAGRAPPNVNAVGPI